MTALGDFTVTYARALVSASSPDQLVNPGKPKNRRRVSPEEIEQIERELSNLRGEIERIEATFASDNLDLMLATSYVRTLLSNAEITRYIDVHHGNLLQEFRRICEATAPALEAVE